jgi:RNA polymerase sigma factor (sigma-70 family)
MNSLLLNSLFKRYRLELCQRIRNNFGSGPPDPEDIVQQTFMKVSELQLQKPIANPKAFLFSLAKNLCIDHYRQQSRHEKLVDSIFAEANLDAIEHVSAETIMLRDETLSQLNDFMDSLNQKQKTLLRASRIEGFTYQQISEQTGYSVSDICRTLHLTIEKLTSDFLEQESLSDQYSVNVSLSRKRV